MLRRLLRRYVSTIALAIATASLAQAQSNEAHVQHFYGKVPEYWTVNRSQLAVRMPSTDDDTLSVLRHVLGAERCVETPVAGWCLLLGVTDARSYSELRALAVEAGAEHVSPVFQTRSELRRAVLPALFLKLNQAASVGQVHMLVSATLSVRSVEPDWSGMSGVFKVDLNECDGARALEVAALLAHRPEVAFCEPDLLIEGLYRHTPTDPLFGEQWPLNNTGQLSGWTPEIDLRVIEAWDVTRGDPSVKVALLDCGVELTHPDLQGNLVNNADFTGQGGDGGPVASADKHGTAMAGVIVAEENGIGVVGIAPLCKLMSLRVAGTLAIEANLTAPQTWMGVSGDFVAALEHARAQGARITVCGFEFGSDINVIEQKYIATAVQDDMLHFASGGNTPSNNQMQIDFPGRINAVYAIGGMFPTGCIYGDGGPIPPMYVPDDQLDFFAPADQVRTTDRTSGGYSSNSYAFVDGSSFAAAYAAGTAALMLSKNPRLSRTEVRNAMTGPQSALTPCGGPGVSRAPPRFRLDAKSSLENVPDPPPDPGTLIVAWVNFAYVGPEYGTQSEPYNTLEEALVAIQNGGTINILAGNRPGSIIISRQCTIVAPAGAVTFGAP